MSLIQKNNICEGSTKAGKKCTYKKKIGNFCKIHSKTNNQIQENKEQKIELPKTDTIQSLNLEKEILTKLLTTYIDHSDLTSKIVDKIDLINCKIDALKFKNIAKHEECEICFIEKDIFIQLICGHYFCTDCTDNTLKSTKNKCPKCKRHVETNEEEK
jgi:hypothetical protein